MTDANAHVAEMEAQMDELRAAAREYRPAPDLHTIDAEEVIDPQDIEVEVTEEPARRNEPDAKRARLRFRIGNGGGAFCCRGSTQSV